MRWKIDGERLCADTGPWWWDWTKKERGKHVMRGGQTNRKQIPEERRIQEEKELTYTVGGRGEEGGERDRQNLRAWMAAVGSCQSVGNR